MPKSWLRARGESRSRHPRHAILHPSRPFRPSRGSDYRNSGGLDACAPTCATRPHDEHPT